MGNSILEIKTKKDLARRMVLERERSIRFRRMGEYWFDGTCVICGDKEGPFEFDHIDPSTKLFNLSSRTNKSIHVWWKELMKCQLLCKPCHIKKSKVDNYRPCLHGTHSMYSNHGCRCDACRLGEREYQSNYYRGISK